MDLPVKFVVRILNEHQWNIVINTLINYYNDLSKYHYSQKDIESIPYDINDRLLECICSDEHGFIGNAHLAWFENQLKHKFHYYGDTIYSYEEFIELFKYKSFDINNLINDLNKLESKFK